MGNGSTASLRLGMGNGSTASPKRGMGNGCTASPVTSSSAVYVECADDRKV